MTKTLTVTGVSAWVDVDHPDEIVEGHYMTTDTERMRLAQSDVICPFCSSPMETVTASSLGRIVFERERIPTKVRAIVDLVPATHEALQCSNTECQMILTRVR